MATITSTSCGTSTIVAGAGTTPNNSYYLNSNPSGFLTVANLDGRLITQQDSLPSGASLYRVNFQSTLNSAPTTVLTNLLNATSGVNTFTNIVKSIDRSGFYIEFSNTLGSGYSLMSNYVSGSSIVGAFLAGTPSSTIISQRDLLSSGANNYRINFPNVILTPTALQVELLNSGSGSPTYPSIIRSIDTSGFNIEFSNTIGSGYYLMSTYLSGNTNIGAVNSYITNYNTILSGGSGSSDLSSVVFTTGAQTIGGVKTFSSGLIVNYLGQQSILANDFFYAFSNNVAAIDTEERALVDASGNQSVFWGERYLESSGESLNWRQKQLSGNWRTNTRPTSSGDIINYAFLTGVSGALQSLITVSSAGVSSLNGSSGALSLAGAGNVTISNIGQAFTVSGNTGAYINFVTTGQTGSFGSASLTNVVFTTGDQIISGIKIFPNYIQAYRINDTGSAGGTPVIECTERTLLDSFGNDSVHFNLRQLHNVSEIPTVDWNTRTLSGDWITNTNPTGNLHIINRGYLTGVSGVLSDRLNTTGQTLISLISAASAGVSSLNGASGVLTLTGAGNVTVSNVGQGFTISGNTGIYSTFVTTGQTGSFGGAANTGQLTGAFYPLNSNPSNFITNSGFITGVDNIGAGSGLFSGVLNNKLELKTLIGGNGIQISGSSSNNSLTFNVTGITSSSSSSNTWNTVTGDTTIVTSNSYVVNGAGLVNLTLPTVFELGSPFNITSISNSGWKVIQNSGQSIRFGNTLTTSGTSGYIQSTSIGDSVQIACVNSNSGFMILNSIGNIIIN